MRFHHLALPLLALLLFTGGIRKPPLAFRVHVEANQQDTTTFASAVELQYPTPHTAYVEKIPRISERDVRSIFLTPANDGTWGCAFKLDDTGRLHLEVLSTDMRGKSLVVFLQTKTFTHQVIDLIIDRPISDGVIFVPHGITANEVKILEKEFRVANPRKNKGEH
jgi:hypothetical protein